MSDKRVRVRFAPSPTGPLHIGGVRTALYNYLFAKKHGGDFILRIEDTDQTRFVEGAQEYIIDALNWAGIAPNEGATYGGNYGPYIQSERKEMYKPYAEELINNGWAYYAFDTPEELDNMREQAKKMGMPNFQYNCITRNNMKNSLTLPSEEVEKRLANGDHYTIRFKMPRNEDVRFEDEIRGWIVVNTNNLDDKVLFKSDGMPTYHLANIVDDHTMEISHVIRGEEWLPSAPLHVLLYQAFGWDVPRFAHLPLILKPNGKGKLSKRDGDEGGFPVFPTNWLTKTGETFIGFREQGYFKEAFTNMLAFLGWNPGTNQELFTLDELVENFSLERVNKAGARFDPDKTKWFNQQYLRNTNNEELAKMLVPVLEGAGISCTEEYAAGVCGLMKERATFINDIYNDGDYFFGDIQSYDEKTVRKKWKDETPQIMEELTAVLSGVEQFDTASIETAFSKYLNDNEYGFGKVGPGFRLLVTGKGMGPSMFDICALLGKEKVLARMESGIAVINGLKAEA